MNGYFILNSWQGPISKKSRSTIKLACLPRFKLMPHHSCEFSPIFFSSCFHAPCVHSTRIRSIWDAVVQYWPHLVGTIFDHFGVTIMVSRLWWISMTFLCSPWIMWLATEYHSPSQRSTILPEYSFLKSLSGFLLKHANDCPPAEQSAPATLNVFVYEMPAKFTTDLLWLFQNFRMTTANWTSNGSPVHRLIEQHSVDFWLFANLMEREETRLLPSVVRRVGKQELADVFYIPFFTTIPFFLLPRSHSRLLYREAVEWITGQPAWQSSGGRDHVLAVHHPWSMKSHRRFLKRAIWLLPDLDSSRNWYKEGEVSLEKDVVMPYVANVKAYDPDCLATSASLRKTLLFFRGRIVRNSGGKIRAQLAAVLRDENEGVVMQEGSIGVVGKAATQYGMRRSVFCLSPAGDTPSSARLFDAMVSGCIPVVVSDQLELPFEGILDYRQVAVFVPASQAIQKGWLVAHLRNKTSQEVAAMQHHLAQYARHFQYATPAQPGGPEELTWRMVAGKLPSVRLHIRRSQRLVQGALNVCTCQCVYANLSQNFI